MTLTRREQIRRGFQLAQRFLGAEQKPRTPGGGTGRYGRFSMPPRKASTWPTTHIVGTWPKLSLLAGNSTPT